MKRIEIIGVNTSELPKLTGAESNSYLKRIKEGDDSLREEFIVANLRLVLSIVQRFSASKAESDDLFQVGCVGLMKALNNFDTSQNVRFSTYAVPMVIGEIRRYLRESSGIKVSRSLRDTAYKALRAREELIKAGREFVPSLTEIAAEIDIPVSEIACALDAVSEPISYFEPVFNDSDDNMMLMEQISDTKNNDEFWTENISLYDALSLVTPREREILYLRYFIGKTQIEISNAVNISQAQVSRLEKNAIKTIRNHLQ
ncbi:MAG: sigma-70 family RNA polymerase sigma factor [Clostridia bacterium]